MAWRGMDLYYMGGLNGLWQVLGDILKPTRKILKRILQIDSEAFSHKLLQIIVTFWLVDFTWIFFRAPSMYDAINIIHSMINAKNFWIFWDDSLFSLGLDWKNFIVLVVAIGILIFADILKYRGIVIHKIIAKQGIWFRWLILIAGFVAVLLFGVWGSGYDEVAFIYFQF